MFGSWRKAFANWSYTRRIGLNALVLHWNTFTDLRNASDDDHAETSMSN